MKYEELYSFIETINKNQEELNTGLNKFIEDMGKYMACDFDVTLKKNNINIKNLNINELDLSKYDEKTILAIISGIICFERLQRGYIKNKINNGEITKLLSRLKELDK